MEVSARDPASAATELASAAELDPASVPAHAALSRAMMALGRYEEAAAVCVQFLESGAVSYPPAEIYEALSDALFELSATRSAEIAEPMPEGVVSRQCRYGTFLIPTGDTGVGRSLAIYGEWSEAEIDLFRKFVRPGMTVLDVGAHIGVFTLPLAGLVGAGGLVLAFEP